MTSNTSGIERTCSANAHSVKKGQTILASKTSNKEAQTLILNMERGKNVDDSLGRKWAFEKNIE